MVQFPLYDKRDDLSFDVVNVLFLYGGVRRSTSYGAYISQLICFAVAFSHDSDFSCRNKLCKALSKFYRRHSG